MNIFNKHVQEVVVGQHNLFANNTLGNILDQGTDTYIDDSIVAARISDRVWATPVTTPVVGSYGELISDNFAAIAASIIAADLLATTGSTTTIVKTGATQADSFYDGLIVVVSNIAGTVARKINSYSQTDGAFTLDTALPFVPSVGDRFIVLGRIASAAASVDNNAIAIAVWARSTLSPTVGSYGELVNQIGDLAALIPSIV